MVQSRRWFGIGGVLVALVGITSPGCSLLLGEKATRTVDYRFPLPSHGAVVIQGANGSITCQAGAVDQIEVEATFVARAPTVEDAERLVQSLEVAHQVDENGTHIDARLPRGVSGGVSLKVTLPRDSELALKTSNGSFVANGFALPVSARTSNGKVTLRDCEAEIDAHTSNGSIQLAGHAMTSITAKTSNGSVHIDGSLAAGNHRVQTPNGAIQADLTGPPLYVRGTTSNGGVYVNGTKVKKGERVTVGTADRNLSTMEPAGTLELSTSNGGIHVDYLEAADSQAPTDLIEVEIL